MFGMCGRYGFYKNDEFSERFGIDVGDIDLTDNYNVAPGQTMPIIVSLDNKPSVRLMRWGLVPVWAKDLKIGYKLINARSETLFDKPMWKSLIKSKRCLIPANGFYEWRKEPEGSKTVKQPYFIKPKDEKLFAFAGLWSTWKDVEGMEWDTYSIITTQPNKEMSAIHDRMPVILHQDDESSWLSPTNDSDRLAIEAVLRPFDNDGLEMWEVSTDVNAVKNNNEKLIYPLNSQ